MIGRRGLACAILLGMAGLPAAQAREATASGNASASVVRPLSTTALADLSFGAITVGNGPAAGGTVIVAPQGTGASYSGSARHLCSGGPSCQPHPARFAVSGEGGRSYRVSLPASVAAVGSRSGAVLAVADLAMQSANSAHSAGGLLDIAGHDSFAVGGTLLVTPGTPADSYRAEFSVTVSYD